MKKVLIGVLALIMVLGLVGCSSTPVAEETNTVEPTETVPVETESQTVEETPETIKELKLGETASTDIFELTLDNADLAIALNNSYGTELLLPKEYNAEEDNKNPYVAPTGYTLVAFTFTASNIDRGGNIEINHSPSMPTANTFSPFFVSFEYNNQTYDIGNDSVYDRQDLRTQYGVVEGFAKEDESKMWSSYSSSKTILMSGDTITLRGCLAIPVEAENLEEQFKLIFHLPTSSGETEDFVYVVN